MLRSFSLKIKSWCLRWLDSYDHYRYMGLGIVRSIYRAFYYEIRGKEPWA